MPASSRNTKQRQAVLHALTDSGFRSAQQLHAELAAAGISIGLSTVYRNLTLLCAAGEVDVQLNADGESVFRKCSDDHHHHLVCRNCGAAEEIAAAAVETWATAIAKQYGYSQLAHTVELSGICRNCQS